MTNQINVSLSALPITMLEGKVVELKTELSKDDEEFCPEVRSCTYSYTITDENEDIQELIPCGLALQSFDTTGLVAGTYKVKVKVVVGDETSTAKTEFSVMTDQVKAAVTLQRSGSFPTRDQALWVAIRNRTSAIDFNRFDKFIQHVFCENGKDLAASADNKIRDFIGSSIPDRPLSFQGPYAYAVLKLAAQVFLTLECGVVIRNDHTRSLFNQEQERIRLGDSSITLKTIKDRLKDYLQFDNPAALPYLDRIVNAIFRGDSSANNEVLPYCNGILQHRMTKPSLLELIWSYWHEEGMLVQTMNAITLRFQNIRSSPRNPLGELEIDPLRPLNNLLWGYIQDEQNRLTIPRRASEYDHQYGLKLVGKAVPNFVSADSRSKFIEAFHNLLYRTATFYKADADTTVIADAFPLLNALREVHLLLAEGAHNQFGDLPWTARSEMLIMQWLLARPEMREFLRGRHMVPYQEPWMGAVDCMKKLQGWTDTTVTHFHELAVTGERIILSMRYGDWSNIDNIEEQAKNWARYWKPEIQRYIHGYQTATGVDLMAEVTDSRDASQRLVQPSVLLQRRLAGNAQQGRIPTLTRETVALTSQRSRAAELPASGQGRFLKHMKDL